MLRVLSIGLMIVAGLIWAQGDAADAAVISRNNPYRSFNISGINYGSTQWQKSHNKSTRSWSSGRSGGFFRRR